MIVGRRMRIQRLSILRVIEQARARLQRHFLVVHGIEEADDLAVDADGAGNPDLVAEGGA